MKQSIFRRFLGAAITLLAALPSFAQWDTTNLDTVSATVSHEHAGHNALATDVWGNLICVYEQWAGFGPRTLYYSVKAPGQSWFGAPVPIDTSSNPFQAVVTTHPAIFHPVIAAVVDERITVMYEGEFAWFIVPVSPDSQDVLSPSIAIDNNGVYHVAWIFEDGDDNYKVGYAFGDGFFFETMALDYDLGTFGGGAEPKIVADASNIAHILFRGGDYPNYEIQHAESDGNPTPQFSINSILTTSSADYVADVVADDFGFLHAAIHGNEGFGMPGRIHYVLYNPDFGWTFDIIASAQYSAADPAIAVDAAGNPHIIWAELSGNFYTGVMYYSTTNDVGGWQSQELLGDDYMTPSFVITDNGFGHMLINSGANTGIDDLFTLSSTSPLFSGAMVEFFPQQLNFGEVETGDSLTLDAVLHNRGTVLFNVTSVGIAGDGFTTNLSGAFPVPAGDSIEFQVTFRPAAELTYDGAVIIESDVPSSPDSLPLTGIGVTPSSVEPAPVPAAFYLNQNYPNPFNPSTRINFGLPADGFVRIVVRDVLGRDVAVLANELRRSGQHSVEWNASGHAAGIYWLDMQSGDFQAVRKMILLK